MNSPQLPESALPSLRTHNHTKTKSTCSPPYPHNIPQPLDFPNREKTTPTENSPWSKKPKTSQSQQSQGGDYRDVRNHMR